MAGRFVNPFPQFLDATPTVRAGARLFFYAAGTSTKLSTYSDKALSSANTNPVVLNSAGYPSVDIYLQDLDYKVVLAPSTDTDPPASPIWTADYVRARDSALVAKTLTGSGSPNGTVAGTAGSSSILPDFYWDYTNSLFYVCTTTGTISTAVWTALNAATAAAVVPHPQGYLTPTSATPVISADVTSATSIYYTPLVGNLVPIYNGASFNPTAFTELTLSLVAAHAASNIYDVYVFNNSGVPTIVTGPSWSAGTSGSITAGSCARGTGAGGAAITKINGIWTNAVQITGRNGSTTYTIGANLATYVGTIFIDTSDGAVTFHRSYGINRKWGAWNAYNRKTLTLISGEVTSSWNNPSATIRASNGTSANVVTTLCGLPEETYDLTHSQLIVIKGDGSSAAQQTASCGIGYNSTTTFSGTSGTVAVNENVSATQIATGATAQARYTAPPAIGINNVRAVEQGNAASSVSVLFWGSQSNQLLRATWLG